MRMKNVIRRLRRFRRFRFWKEKSPGNRHRIMRMHIRALLPVFAASLMIGLVACNTKDSEPLITVRNHVFIVNYAFRPDSFSTFSAWSSTPSRFATARPVRATSVGSRP